LNNNLFQEIPTTLSQYVFWFEPLPSPCTGNSSLASYFPLKASGSMAFETSLLPGQFPVTSSEVDRAISWK